MYIELIQKVNYGTMGCYRGTTCNKWGVVGGTGSVEGGPYHTHSAAEQQTPCCVRLLVSA